MSADLVHDLASSIARQQTIQTVTAGQNYHTAAAMLAGEIDRLQNIKKGLEREAEKQSENIRAESVNG